MEERARMEQDQKYLDFAYKCGNCIKGFSFKGSYDKHMEKHNQVFMVKNIVNDLSPESSSLRA